MNKKERINRYNRFLRQHEDIMSICKARDGDRCKDCICSNQCDFFQTKYNDRPCDFDALAYFNIKGTDIEGEIDNE